MSGEAEARAPIDRLLGQAGWDVQDVARAPILTGVEIQSDKYVTGLPAGLPCPTHRLAPRATAHTRGCGLDSPPRPARQKLARHQ